MLAVLLLTLIVFFETVEQLAFADGARNKARKWARWAIGCLAHVAGILVWLPVLTLIPISVALPLTGLCYVSTSFAAKIFLHEKFSFRRGIALGLIICGACLIYFDGGWHE